MKRIVAALGLVAALAVSALPAHANLITTGNTGSFTIFESCTTGSGATCPGSTTNVNSTLSATASFGNFLWSNNNTTLSFQIALFNTTPQGTQTTAQWQADRLTAFGFNTNPDATSVTGSSVVFNTFTETNFPSFNTVDICESSGSTCPGGSNGGLAPIGSGSALPGSDLISLSLNGLNGIIGIDFGTEGPPGSPENDYFLKFQTSFGSFEPTGNSTLPCPPGAPGCVVNPPVDVPEPGSLALMGSALLGFGAFTWMRRRRWGNDQDYRSFQAS